ncbi:unnamed protein product [Ostreobium quekettii]|uniref:Uncharacterized protein n=1 Tax=Ostreobium quekettii TaxID=121088 RepID=A0A8S1J325_9CHLO|nr:unnamed protein product [Ostreobium quekettii]|eukprot:evm.model.scf_243.6 EVM.evm.TU.scf_243.6   scf_243:27429-30194(-)
MSPSQSRLSCASGHMALGHLSRSLGGLLSGYSRPAAVQLPRVGASAWQRLRSYPFSASGDPASQVDVGATPDASRELDSAAVAVDQVVAQSPSEPSADPSTETTTETTSTGTVIDLKAAHSVPAGSSSGPSATGRSNETTGGEGRERMMIPRDDSDPGAAFVTVQKDGTLRRATGRIHAALAEGKRVVLYATGGPSVSNAVKAVLLARRKEGEGGAGSDLGFKVVHQPGVKEDRVTKFMFALHKVDYRVEPDTPPDQIFRADVHANCRVYGSLIASNLELGRPCAIQAMGPGPVAAVVVAHTWARKILKGSGHDCLCFPEFKRRSISNEVEKTEVRMTFVKVPYDLEQDFKPQWNPIETAANRSAPLADTSSETSLSESLDTPVEPMAQHA